MYKPPEGFSMMTNEDLLKLLDRVSRGVATDEEIGRYNSWCNAFQAKGTPVPDIEEIKARMLPEIKKQIHRRPKRHILGLWPRIAAAASVLLVLAAGGYFLLHRHQPASVARDFREDVAPGGNKAVLTLANGQTIVLDNARTGQLARQGGSKVMKIDSGVLAYQSQKLKAESLKQEVTFNTLTVPRGGQYQLILPDGTKVWLNAASSIRYPTAFRGKEREISITGEVYLEVARDARHPFVVSTRNSDITVLGTRFNIMAYDNEPAVNTTLLDGSVKVSVRGKPMTTVLAPGQQASVDNARKGIRVKKVNAANTAAWIHGLLSLEDCSVHEFMNQLSRWYDVDIEYAGKIPDQRFGGMINRNTSLSDVLSALDAAGIHTKLQGKKIIVLSL